MTIGEVIRKYRRELGLTQEEMADRLGVTTPAVNKWENNNTQPDISLLAPIARLLGITTDTLLSYRDELTDEEISAFVRHLTSEMDKRPYDEVFNEAEGKVREYPSCTKLIWNVGVAMDSARLTNEVADSKKYDDRICDWWTRVLDADDAIMRKSAATSLFHYYLENGDCENANGYLSYLSQDDPDRRSHQAELYDRSGQTEEAFREYEELVLYFIEHLRLALNALQVLYIKNDNMTMAKRMADIQGALATLFDMGEYQKVSARLDIAAHEKDAAETAKIMEILINNCDTVTDFLSSELFTHLKPRSVNADFLAKLKTDIISGFCDEEAFGYMKGNGYWERLRKNSFVTS